MAMGQDEVVKGLLAEMRYLRGVVAPLTKAEWAMPTRCEGWAVSDVAAHLTGVMADITAGRLEGIDTQPWYDRQVSERRGQLPRMLVAEMDDVIVATHDLMTVIDEAAWNGPGVPGVDGTLGSSIQALWCGGYIHNEDILAALSRPPQKGPGLRAAIDHIADVLTVRGWGPATLVLAGMDELSIGSGGHRIDADPLTFALVGSGRANPAVLGMDATVNIYG
jgi:uncharacterized protein (TIGR03083 family)